MIASCYRSWIKSHGCHAGRTSCN